MNSFALVIPNLNQSHYLPTAIESLKHQSASFNLALMDGGSTDNFPNVLNEYAHMLAYVSSSPDGGQAAAIRKGKEIVRGDIVAWLNADDYYFPNALDKVAECFRRDPELGVVYGDAIHVKPDGSFLSYFPAIQEFSANNLTRTCFICQPACFVRRTVYNQAGGVDPSLSYTMDWDLWCRISRCGARFLYLKDVLAAVRYYPGTKTLSGNWKRYMEIWRIEHRYGKRLLPSSWFGTYLFDLLQKEKLTFIENVSKTGLNLLRKLKQRTTVTKTETLYGFNKWQQIVEGEANIQIPWYGKNEWSQLALKVSPRPDLNDYIVNINGNDCEIAFDDALRLVVKVPRIKSAFRNISIKCISSRFWQLNDFQYYKKT